MIKLKDLLLNEALFVALVLKRPKGDKFQSKIKTGRRAGSGGDFPEETMLSKQ